jgi:hypothetical protein
MSPKHVARQLAFSNLNTHNVALSVQTMIILSCVHFVMSTWTSQQLQVDLYEITTDTVRMTAEGNLRRDWLEREVLLHFTVFLCTKAGIALPFLSFLCGLVAPFLRLGEFGTVSFSMRSLRTDKDSWLGLLLPGHSVMSVRNQENISTKRVEIKVDGEKYII